MPADLWSARYGREMEAVQTGMTCISTQSSRSVTYLGAGKTEECSLGLGHLAITLWEMRAIVGLKPRFEALRVSFTMLILEKRGRLVRVSRSNRPGSEGHLKLGLAFPGGCVSSFDGRDNRIAGCVLAYQLG
jgi:hypothetical protein